MGHGKAIATTLLLAAVACGGRGGAERDRPAEPTTSNAASIEASTTDRARSTSPGGTFDTDHGPVTLVCAGEGPVPVILIAGTDDPISRWDGLVGALGPTTATCRYVPPGDESAPATPAIRADALAEALDASEIPGPYLLVGHSLGGLTVRRFGDRHPDLLRAALLLDPTTPLALLSLDDVLLGDGWDPAATRSDMEAPAVWPAVPLSVLAHDPVGEPLGLGPDVEALWTEGQQTYVALTTDAHFEAVPDAGHHIDRDAPGRVVTEVARLVDEVTS